MSELTPISRLSRDLANAAKSLSVNEARYLVDAYYTMQEYRIAANNQVRALSESGEPHEVIAWLAAQQDSLESQIQRALDKWTDAQPIGVWLKSICGIGPVIAAGLIANIDIRKAETAGHIWNFAGLNPGVSWQKGEKRPWNASLKTLCWKIGESFVKVSGRPSDFYGKLYIQRKAFEAARNERGELQGQAEAKLEKFKIGKTTDAYKAYSVGKLPPAHIHARARRWAVKLFLSHLHEVWYEMEFGVKPVRPYAMQVLGHSDEHYIEPPNMEFASFTRE